MELTKYEADILARLVMHHTTSTDERMLALMSKLDVALQNHGAVLGQPFAASSNPDLYGKRPMVDVDREYRPKATLIGMPYGEFQKYMAGYGFTQCPLTHNEFDTCRTLKLDVDTAYRVACDVNAGLEFGRALIPYLTAKHEKGPDCDGYDGTYDRQGNPVR